MKNISKRSYPEYCGEVGESRYKPLISTFRLANYYSPSYEPGPETASMGTAGAKTRLPLRDLSIEFIKRDMVSGSL